MKSVCSVVAGLHGKTKKIRSSNQWRFFHK
jgi:hypothetical protein